MPRPDIDLTFYVDGSSSKETEFKFLKADGKPILNNLLDSIMLPYVVSICKCLAHTSTKDPIAKGNAYADAAAKTVRSPVHV